MKDVHADQHGTLLFFALPFDGQCNEDRDDGSACCCKDEHHLQCCCRQNADVSHQCHKEGHRSLGEDDARHLLAYRQDGSAQAAAHKIVESLLLGAAVAQQVVVELPMMHEPVAVGNESLGVGACDASCQQTHYGNVDVDDEGIVRPEHEKDKIEANDEDASQ